ncbi:MAG: DUF1036 domain-containing protein [Pseudomonadota bacterium]
MPPMVIFAFATALLRGSLEQSGTKRDLAGKGMAAKRSLLADGVRARLAKGLLALLLSLALSSTISLAAPDRAFANLKLCNTTSSRVGVAIGYRDDNGWATEGWWNVSSQACETLLRGAVPSRYIYVYAVDYDRGGAWVGKNFMCTNEKSFAIRGAQDCIERGYKSQGFFEVDTGDAKEWTIRLTDPQLGAN